jgi:hypothetical protein
VRTWLVVATLFIGCSSHAHANETPPNSVEIQNPSLFRALQDIRQVLKTDRTEFSFENGRTSKNCIEYLNLLPASPPSETTRNSEIRSEYLLCDSVRIISDGPFVAREKKLAGYVTKALFEKLDLRTFPSSLRNRTDNKKNTLKTLFPGQVKFQDSGLQIETSDNFFKLEVVGVVHRGAKPTTEWVVWVTDEVKGGNYKSYRTIVVRASEEPSGRYAATMYP